MVIWANQVLRGAVQGMQQTLATLARERRLDALDPHIVPLERDLQARRGRRVQER